MIEELNGNDKMAYTLDEAGPLIGVSKSKLRKDIAAEKLKARLIGRKVVILRKDLSDYLDRETRDWSEARAERMAVAV